MISDLTGKKVYLETGDFVGVINEIFVDELGYTVAIIKTEYSEMPEIRVNVITLRKIKRDEEECYIMKSPPLKLVEVIKEKKREEEIRRLERELAQKEVIEEEVKEEVPAEEAREGFLRRLINKIMNVIRKILGK